VVPRTQAPGRFRRRDAAGGERRILTRRGQQYRQPRFERGRIPESVDSLHLRAGSRNLLELHGSLRVARCTGCDACETLDASGLPLERIEHSCGGRLRPDIVWFGEALPARAWEKAAQAASRAEVILVVGTSAVVYPAAALATSYSRSAYVAEINPEETAISQRVDCTIRSTAAEALPKLYERLA
jgi:NAD-dependent deacetylase